MKILLIVIRKIYDPIDRVAECVAGVITRYNTPWQKFFLWSSVCAVVFSSFALLIQEAFRHELDGTADRYLYGILYIVGGILVFGFLVSGYIGDVVEPRYKRQIKNLQQLAYNFSYTFTREDFHRPEFLKSTSLDFFKKGTRRYFNYGVQGKWDFEKLIPFSLFSYTRQTIIHAGQSDINDSKSFICAVAPLFVRHASRVPRVSIFPSSDFVVTRKILFESNAFHRRYSVVVDKKSEKELYEILTPQILDYLTHLKQVYYIDLTPTILLVYRKQNDEEQPIREYREFQEMHDLLKLLTQHMYAVFG